MFQNSVKQIVKDLNKQVAKNVGKHKKLLKANKQQIRSMPNEVFPKKGRVQEDLYFRKKNKKLMKEGNKKGSIGVVSLPSSFVN